MQRHPLVAEMLAGLGPRARALVEAQPMRDGEGGFRPLIGRDAGAQAGVENLTHENE
jgi:hypothetical protein